MANLERLASSTLTGVLTGPNGSAAKRKPQTIARSAESPNATGCPQCDDTRYVQTSPEQHGSYKACPTCEADFGRGVPARLRRVSGLWLGDARTPSDFDTYRFDQWSLTPNGPDGFEGKRSAMLAAAQDFAADQSDSVLSFVGDTGAGKSFLLKGIAIALVERMEHVVYTTGRRLIAEMKAAFDGKQDHRGEPISPEIVRKEYVEDIPWLVIDEMLATAEMTQWELGMMDQLLCERLDLRRPTAIGTNADGGELPPRVWSRMNYGDVISTKGMPDIRIKDAR